MQVELMRQGLEAEIEQRLTVRYKDAIMGDYMAELYVADNVIVESKSRRNTTGATKLK